MHKASLRSRLAESTLALSCYLDWGHDRATGCRAVSATERLIEAGNRLGRSRATSFDTHTRFVYTGAMIKNITLSADEALIEQARRRAMTGTRRSMSCFASGWRATWRSQPPPINMKR